MTIREGRWLCQFCGAENLGRFESCQGHGSGGCGAARQPGTRFYLPENSPVVTDEALIADARSGRDWNCDHCGGANKGAMNGHPLTRCAHCGEARDAEDAQHETVFYGQGQEPRTAEAAQASLRAEEELEDKARLTERRSPQSSPSAVSATTKSESGAFKLRPLILVPLILGALLLAFSVFRTTEETADILRLRWERTVQIEEFRTLRQEGWDPPADARVLSSETRLKNWDNVLVGYETKNRPATRTVRTGTESYGCGTRDLGNGFFEDQTCTRDVYGTETYTETYQEPVYERVPRYDDWEVYEVDRWVPARRVVASGDDASPRWPVPVLGPRERAGARHGEYVVTYENPSKAGERLTSKMSDSEWASAARGGRLIAKVNYWGFNSSPLT